MAEQRPPKSPTCSKNASASVARGNESGDMKDEDGILEYIEVSESPTKTGKRSRKSKNRGDSSVGTDSVTTISTTSITIASDETSGKIEAMLGDISFWEDEVSTAKKGLKEISETEDESISEDWNSGDLEIGNHSSLHRRESDLPSHEDPFAPRPGRTLKWRNVNMTLVSWIYGCKSLAFLGQAVA